MDVTIGEEVMQKWLKRIRGAIGMGLTWAAAWAVFGVMIGAVSLITPSLPWDSFFDIFDAPLPTLAIPGFVGGVLFSIVLGIAGRRRKFDELSLARFAAWGAVGGLLLALFPDFLVALGLATVGPEAMPLGKLTAVISVPLIALGAASAAGSLMLARLARKKEPIEGNQEIPMLNARSRTVANVRLRNDAPQEGSSALRP